MYRAWFAKGKLASSSPPLSALAGIWRSWIGVRGTNADPVEGEHLLYSFLTSQPNGVLGRIHLEAMPVILTTPKKYDSWLTASTEEALKLQRPLPDDMMRIVADGRKSDPAV
jgi:putative SOS response-associated peptidase YedK